MTGLLPPLSPGEGDPPASHAPTSERQGAHEWDGAFCCASWPRPLESLTQPLGWRLAEGPVQTVS